ncbi:MAG: nucleotidyltransferase, partial [Lachnospiraceae bacterium]|nr:nucleotidyltransferase [Lachnospiraceae bacterium]
RIQVEYVFQDINNLPEGFEVPEGRTKPWGTAHAVLSCLPVIDGPFAVINADDYYGQQAFQMIYDFLASHEDNEKYQYTMVGYLLENTLTENGHVARGVCGTNEAGKLTEITERVRIEKREDGPAYTEDEGSTWTGLAKDTIVSMNMWGFTRSILQEIHDRFASFLKASLPENPLKCEYFLPFVVDELIQEEKAEVTVLKSRDRWYGVTYKEDKPTVMKAIQALKDEGCYPQKLWE